MPSIGSSSAVTARSAPPSTFSAFNWSAVYAMFGALMLAIGLALDYFL